MAEPARRPMTVDEFFEWESRQQAKYELIEGIIYMMVGGSAAHAAIRDSTTAALNAKLAPRGCRAYAEFRVDSRINATYPDVAVACPALGSQEDRIVDPLLIIEVLSESTEDNDHNKKWRRYRMLPSLQYYLMSAHDERRVEM